MTYSWYQSPLVSEDLAPYGRSFLFSFRGKRLVGFRAHRVYIFFSPNEIEYLSNFHGVNFFFFGKETSEYRVVQLH